MARRRRFWTILGGILAVLLIIAGTAGYQVYRLGRIIEAENIVPLHAPGTYFFARFKGGVVGPFQPRDEIPFRRAASRDSYCIGIYDEKGRLVRIERRFRGVQVFRVEYGYDAAGKIYELGKPPIEAAAEG